MAPRDLDALLAAALDPLPQVRVAWLFGSRANGRPRADSDLDVAVRYDPALDTWGRERVRREIVVALADRLGALGERADVVDVDRAPVAVAFAAIRARRCVLCRDERERVDIVARIARRHDDEAPRRALVRAAARRLAETRDG
jgi:hypothetical protein